MNLPATLPAAARDGSRDFDFLYGNWNVHNRRLRHPLAGSDESYEFGGTATARPLWGGKGNVDEVDFDSPLGRIEAMTLRTYDPRTRLWSIYWATAANGLVPVPTVGAFDGDGVGEFFDDEIFEGRPIVCRYRWTHDGSERCRWEQAFSPDGGTTWETNWSMDFTRTR